MKTQTFRQHGTMKSLEVAVVISLVSLASFNLLKSGNITLLFKQKMAGEKPALINDITHAADNSIIAGAPSGKLENPAAVENKSGHTSSVESVKTEKKSIANEKSEVIVPSKNYIVSPDRLAEFLDEEKARESERMILNPDDLKIENLTENDASSDKFSWEIIRHNSIISELKSIVQLKLLLIEEPENPIEIEDWMTDDNLFSSKVIQEQKAPESDKTEIWRIGNNRFGTRKFLLEQAEEKKLDIDDWMVDERLWQAKVKK